MRAADLHLFRFIYENETITVWLSSYKHEHAGFRPMSLKKTDWWFNKVFFFYKVKTGTEQITFRIDPNISCEA